MSKTAETLSRFIQDAPPGEVQAIKEDIVALVEGNNQLVANLDKDVSDYNTKEFAVAEVAGVKTVISPYNKIGDEFFDAVHGKRFSYDHAKEMATVTGDYDGDVSSDVKALNSSLRTYAEEHYPSESAFGVFPQESGNVVVVLVDNKYNASNFWNGRWKAWYEYAPSSKSLVGGEISIDVHYFEDGNVRLKSSKEIDSGSVSMSLVHHIEKVETGFQSEINDAFVDLNRDSFKALRRQLPVTRGKMDWHKPIGGHTIGQDVAASR